MNDMDSRGFILDRIRVALDAQSSDARHEQQLREWQNLPRRYRQISALGEADRTALFDERLRHYGATPFYSNGDIRSDLARILSERRKRVLIAAADIAPEWLPDGFMFLADEDLSNAHLNSTDGIVTCCTLAIALTGTLVLESSPEHGRRAATLIPDYHLSIVGKEQIVELVPEAIRKLQGVKNRPLTFISGPSATVDIEMTRVRGVHGPRTLDVLIV